MFLALPGLPGNKKNTYPSKQDSWSSEHHRLKRNIIIDSRRVPLFRTIQWSTGTPIPWEGSVVWPLLSNSECLTGIIKWDPFWGGMKQFKSMVNLRETPFSFCAWSLGWCHIMNPVFYVCRPLFLQLFHVGDRATRLLQRKFVSWNAEEIVVSFGITWKLVVATKVEGKDYSSHLWSSGPGRKKSPGLGHSFCLSNLILLCD